MPILTLITLLNAAGDDLGWSSLFRVRIGIEINIYLQLTLLGLVGAFLLGGRLANMFPARHHPAIYWTVGVGLLGWLVGVLQMVINSGNLLLADVSVAIAVRDYMAMCVLVFAGYRLLATPQSARRLVLLYVAGGVIASCFVLWGFASGASMLTEGAGIDALRAPRFNPDFAAIACALLLFSTLTPFKIWSGPWRVPAMCFCLVGALAMMNRTDLVALSATFGAVFFILPRGGRIRQAMWAALMAPAIVLTLWVALALASHATHRDFFTLMEDRVGTMLPGSDGTHHAWDTRLPSILHDFEIIESNPMFGGGFGAQEAMAHSRGIGFAEFHHCAWTDVWAKAGIFGFGGVALVVFIPGVLGLRLMRDGIDQAYVLLGALGVVTCVHAAVGAVCSPGMNTIRGVMPVAILAGAIMRARAMQIEQRDLAWATAAEDEQGQLPQSEALSQPDDYQYTREPEYY